MDGLTRREWLRGVGLAGGGLVFPGIGCAAAEAAGMGAPLAEEGTYTLPPLPYAYDALEPVIDELTLRTHHDRHHAGYVKGLNEAVRGLQEARAKGDASQVPALVQKVAFHGSGHVLHTLYWQNLSPKGGGEPGGELATAIRGEFGSFATFRTELATAAKKVQGSGWGILAREPWSGRLVVLQAEKHQNLALWGAIPLLVIDVWEHAYYLKYRNARATYVEAIFKIIHWDDVSSRYGWAKRLA